jgi:hypothetical protein
VDVILVVDMQVGLLEGAPKHDLRGVIDRINRLTAMVRGRSGRVVWIRHCGKPGDGFAPNTAGWAFLPELMRQREDIVIEKTLNDPFAGTPLKETLERFAPDRVLVAVADGHTLSDRPHLDAATVIKHHNWVWSGLIIDRSVRVMTTAQLLDGGQPSPWPKS